jgi:hypothetical protein
VTNVALEWTMAGKSVSIGFASREKVTGRK